MKIDVLIFEEMLRSQEKVKSKIEEEVDLMRFFPHFYFTLKFILWYITNDCYFDMLDLRCSTPEARFYHPDPPRGLLR